ncbi:MAG: GlsB/YeaQ/YmgE family stress response membrane protein [Thermoanaerobaculia bacterium]
MGIIGWIIFGLIVGALAKFVMPGKDPGGWIITTLLGIVGALVGGFLGRMLGLYKENEPAGFIGAFLGAVLVLWIYRKTRKPA